MPTSTSSVLSLIALTNTGSETWEFEGQPASKTLRAPVLTIVCHENLGRVGETCALAPGRAWKVSRKVPGFRPEGGPDAGEPLNDQYISRAALLFEPKDDGSICVHRNDHKGPVYLNREAFADERTLSAVEVEQGVVVELGPRVALLLQAEELTAQQPRDDLGMVGRTTVMGELRTAIRQAAGRSEPVLLLGESGVGKELVARALHERSGRTGEFIAVNMATLPGTIAASELFGHAEGAFTGAVSARAGLFQQARGGTLFLDEIGAASYDVQAMLLRAIEESVLSPVGSDEEQAIEVRVVAATDAPLQQRIEQGKFRSALLHRLASIRLEVPPLRERRADIARLFVHQLEQENGNRKLEGFSAECAARLLSYGWPGNVRQLYNVVRRLKMAARSQDLLRLLDAELTPAAAPTTPPPPACAPEPEVLPEQISQVLAAHDYKVHSAAKALGMSRAALYRRLRAHPDLRAAKDIPEAELRSAFAAADGSLPKMMERLKVSQVGLKMRLRDLDLLP